MFPDEDDQRYFPPYEAVFVIRPTVLRDPQNRREIRDNLRWEGPVAMTMSKLAGAISTDEMRKLNYEVDGARRDKKNVVHDWLVRKGFVQ